MTTFERVYAAVRLIPRGSVATYGQIARAIGNPRLSRVVGYALHVNPEPGVIPCHRVVRRDGAHPELTILAESDDAGVFLLMDQDGKKIFVMGHPEYDRYTLHNEYERDKKKGLDIDMPVNYYPDNDDTQKPLLQWRSHGNILYSNWLNYYVYQEVPYEFINNREIIGK